MIDTKYAGRWQDGYAPDDLDADLPALAEQTKLDLVVVWDLCDSYGPHGSSDLYVRDAAAGKLVSCPAPLFNYLTEDLAPAPPRKMSVSWDGASRLDDAMEVAGHTRQYVWRRDAGLDHD